MKLEEEQAFLAAWKPKAEQGELVVVTLGDQGSRAFTVSGEAQAGIYSPPIFGDTVGAGDTFVGALAVTLAAGIPAAEAVRAAAAAGATAATRPGAQAGMPRPADILATTGVNWPAG